MAVEKNLIPMIHELVGSHVRVFVGKDSYTGVLEKEAECGYIVGPQVVYPWLVASITQVGDIYELVIKDDNQPYLSIAGRFSWLIQ